MTRNTENIVVLTDAGISAESSINTFREDDGLWSKFDLMTVATPQGIEAHPETVLKFYNLCRKQLPNHHPNAAHEALVRLKREYLGKVSINTQNLDDLHERGTDIEVINVHGELLSGLCASCGFRWEQKGDQTLDQQCSRCSSRSCRPDVVWFGEVPYYLDDIYELVKRCDLFASIGTGGEVAPENLLVEKALNSGAETLEINLNTTSNELNLFTLQIEGGASEAAPRWVEPILSVRDRSA